MKKAFVAGCGIVSGFIGSVAFAAPTMPTIDTATFDAAGTAVLAAVVTVVVINVAVRLFKKL